MTGETPLLASDGGDPATTYDITLDGANNDFSTVNAEGANITLVDVNSLTLRDVTATGNLNATAATDLVLSGDVSADTLDLTATAGEINQTGGKLSVNTGQTNLIAGTDITLNSADNDFNGTVNAEGNNIALVDGAGGLTLGDITAGGTLDVTSIDGAIDQVNGTTIAVTGETTLSASDGGDPATTYDITLDDANNDFSTVNAEGANISLVDSGALEFGVVTATANFSVTSTGDLTFGVVRVGGALLAISNGGDITQTGPIRVEGGAQFDAGSGVVDLPDSGNYFPSGVTAEGSSIVVTGDSNATSSQASAGVLYQEVIVEEFAPVRLADSFSSSIVTTDVLGMSEADEQQIKMSLCMSSPVSASLTCISD